MKVALPYHDRIITLHLRGRSGIRIVGDSAPAPLVDVEGELRGSLEHPVGSSPLGDLIPSRGRISILISDLTRGRGSCIILRHLLTILEEGGVERDRVEIVLAAGMHRGLSREELSAHLGDKIAAGWRVREHNATDQAALVEVGKTSRRNRCFFNKRVVESKLAVVIGTVSFHYFAGFGGALFDSLLGATVQGIYRCPSCEKETERYPQHTCGDTTVHIRGWRWLNNDLVNFAASVFGAVVAYIGWSLL